MQTISKVIERIVLSRLQLHLLKSPNFSKYQSAYRPGHSTETAMLGVLNGIYNTINKSYALAMVCLDISAAFDTIHHHIKRLRDKFGVNGGALNCLQSYIYGHTKFIKCEQSSPTRPACSS